MEAYNDPAREVLVLIAHALSCSLNKHGHLSSGARCLNRGVSHYLILPVSRDIGWPVQQLDYFRYIMQHILTIELLYIG